MPTNVQLIDAANSKALLFAKSPVGNGKPVLATVDVTAVFGVFRSVTQALAGTYIFATPSSDDSVQITDIMISAKKTQNTTLAVQYNDDTDSEIVFAPDTVNDPVNFSASFVGRWIGWTGARLEVVTTGALPFTVSIGYIYVHATDESFDTWDSRR